MLILNLHIGLFDKTNATVQFVETWKNTNFTGYDLILGPDSHQNTVRESRIPCAFSHCIQNALHLQPAVGVHVNLPKLQTQVPNAMSLPALGYITEQ